MPMNIRVLEKILQIYFGIISGCDLSYLIFFLDVLNGDQKNKIKILRDQYS